MRGQSSQLTRASLRGQNKNAAEHSPDQCVFCKIIAQEKETIMENEQAIAFYDNYPSSPGHTLFIPKRPVADYFDLSLEEQAAINELINKQKAELDQREPKPDGYNIGLNSNSFAGQTMPHAHVHLIPRYEGDVEDARGGIRHIIPETAKYWEEG
jgi:diadenosine tetraphosphate (Ap4A) HIT family hydrolase